MIKKILTLNALLLLLACNIIAQKSNTIQLPKQIKNQYAYIPNGKAFTETDSVLVDAFYISKYEVTNGEYLEFVNFLLKQGKAEELKIAIPDTSQWLRVQNAQPYAAHYFRHPAYAKHPVMNISHKAAELYCEWLTQKINAESKNVKFEVRLPSRNEWLSAAQCGRKLPYSWKGISVIDSKGSFRANFKRLSAENIHFDYTKGELVVIPDIPYDKMPISAAKLAMVGAVDSFYPNDFGVYNLNGNAAEMIKENEIAVGGSWNCTGYDIRNLSTMPFSGPSPYVGFRPVLTIISNTGSN
jgi:formylglycine-generating enzyme required for sulfatase activity